MATGTRRRLMAGLIAAVCLSAAPASAQVTASLVWHQPDIQSFYLSDFDPSNTATHPDLFTLTLMNTSGSTQSISLKLEISTLIGGDVLLEALTDPFDLSLSGLQISNRDLAESDQPFVLKDYSTTPAAEDLMDKVLETGILPSDTYRFTVRVFPGAGGSEITSAFHDVVVSNPSRVDLITPGDEFGGTLPVVATPTPQFFWSTDALASGITSRFRIKVVKVVEAATAEEAMGTYAVWETEVTDRTNIIYPSSVEAIALEPGSTYAWQVERVVQTSGGTHELESEIYWFKMEAAVSGVTGSSVDEEVDSMITQIQNLQGLSTDLEGFHPTGQVLIDGKPTDLNRLRQLLQKVLSGQIQIATIIIR